MMDYASRLTRSLQGRPTPAGNGQRAGRNAATMPPETIGNEFQFGAVNPAYQPLADGLNLWISGGFTGPDAPGARGPMQSIAKKGRR